MAALSPEWQDRQRAFCGFTDLRAVFDRVKVGHVYACVTGVVGQPALSTGLDHFEPSTQQLGAA